MRECSGDKRTVLISAADNQLPCADPCNRNVGFWAILKSYKFPAQSSQKIPESGIGECLKIRGSWLTIGIPSKVRNVLEIQADK